LRLVTTCFAVAALALACGPTRTADPSLLRTNLVLVSIDTLRADHLASYGYERSTSPRLDAFAAGGAVFRKAMSASSWTLPAHMSMLTGLEPPAHGLIDYPNFERLAEEHATLAEILQARGYETAAFTGGGWVSAKTGMEVGFDTFESDGKRFEDTWPRLERWLERRDRGSPFFLFWHGFNVHKPYRPPPPYDRRFCGKCDSDYDVEQLQPQNPRPSPRALEYVLSQYDGEIAYVDDLFAALLSRLEALGLLENTLVVVTSDHGEEFYEHGMVDHVHTLYDELIGVPLILVGPGVSPAVVHELVGTVDLMPTVLELLGVELDQPVQGVSRVPEIERAAGSHQGEEGKALSAVFGFTSFSRYPYGLASVRTPRWKLVAWELSGMRQVDLDADPDRKRYTFKFRRDRAEDFVELFDLEVDPEEQRDVSLDHPGVVAELLGMLERRIDEAQAYSVAPEDVEVVDEGYVEELRSLGYLE
jgi:arylsulfatase A-like enzyme